MKGRGGSHQIDAIADLRVNHAFSHPQRLLVEGKFYSDERTINIGTIRNTVGVLKDVAEYWTRDNGGPAARRYHYQGAIFSSSDFSSGAQKYAFAHDVYLLPLKRSRYFRPVLQSILTVTEQYEVNAHQNIREFSQIDLRHAARAKLQPGFSIAKDRRDDRYGLEPFIRAVEGLRHSLIGTVGRGFPIFLTPATPEVVDRLQPEMSVRVYWDEDGWYLRTGDERLFSFDLPEELLALYMDRGELTPQRAIDLKEDYLSEIQVVYTRGREIHVTIFRIDLEWLARVRARAGRFHGGVTTNSDSEQFHAPDDEL